MADPDPGTGAAAPVEFRDVSSRVSDLRWYHRIDLGNGIITPGIDNSSQRLARLALPSSFHGCSVLDVGAWDGFFSFEAERRHAARVLATDHYVWRGPGWGTADGKAPFRLAREVLRSKVEDLDIDVMELSPERVGTWDVVLFLGVLYHLKDPLAGLERVASVTKRLLIVETVVDLVGLSQPAMAFYPERQLDSDPTNWWGPNHAAVVAMLRATGFETVDVKEPPKSLAYRTARAAYHAIKGRNQFRLAIRRDRAVFHARK